MVLSGAHGRVESDELHNALIIAATNGSTDCLTILLQENIDVDTEDADSDTPLMLAACNNHAKTVRMLIVAGSAVNHCNDRRRRPLHPASWNGNAVIVQILLDAGAEVDSHDEGKDTPLMVAALGGHANVVQILIKFNAQINLRNCDKDTALHNAAWVGNTETVKLLIEAGADINAQTRWGHTPLVKAVFNDNYDALVTLIEAGCKDSKTYPSKTALHYAVIRGFPQCVKALLAAGFDADVIDEHGHTPFADSVTRCDVPIMTMLVKAGCNVDVTCRIVQDGKLMSRSPLYVAVFKNYLEMAKILFQISPNNIRESHTVINCSYLQRTTENASESLDWLRNAAMEPCALTHLGRAVIRKNLGHKLNVKVTLLPLPYVLKQFIEFSYL